MATIAGNNKKEKDIIISKKVASVANTEWKLFSSDKPQVSNDYIREMFYRSDGMEMYLCHGRYRWADYVDGLSKENFSVCVSGDGGVLHKDWEWIQDFPFYNKKKFSELSFYKQRIHEKSNNHFWGEKIVSAAKEDRKWFAQRLSELKKETNTQSYDMFYNYLTGNRRFEYNLCNGNNCFYAPLQELEAVRISYKAPRFRRFFNLQIRDIISKSSKEISTIPTNYGTTASSDTRYLIRDIWFALAQFVYRAFRYVFRSITGKTIGLQEFTTWDCFDDVKCTDLARDSIEHARSLGYINSELSLDNINEMQLGSLIYLYLWNEIAE